MGRTKRAISEVYSELKERAEEAGLNISVDKTKAMVQSRRHRGREPLTAIDRDIEVVRRFKYLGTVINDTNDETEEIRARMLAAIKPTAPCKPYLDPNKSTETTK
jgi:hypothetical protein